MPFQSNVNVYQAPGIAGDFFDDSPRRVAGAIITSGGIVGNAVTYVNAATDPMQVQGGGASGFAGIIVNGKELIRANAGLSASLAVADETIAPVCTMGHIWVTVNTDIAVGYVGAYDSATGAIAGFATSAAATSGGYVVIDKSKFVAVNATSGGLAVLELN